MTTITQDDQMVTFTYIVDDEKARAQEPGDVDPEDETTIYITRELMDAICEAAALEGETPEDHIARVLTTEFERSGRKAVQRHVTWVQFLSVMPFPDDDEAAKAVLKKGSAAKPARFLEFKMFCMFVGVKYGRFGKGIRPSLSTITEDFDTSTSTAQRYMRTATELGIFRRVEDATQDSPAEYEINPFWLGVKESE